MAAPIQALVGGVAEDMLVSSCKDGESAPNIDNGSMNTLSRKWISNSPTKVTTRILIDSAIRVTALGDLWHRS
ncbi:hypothetical protein SK128_003914 [Halocaridina rubra]|uniref:Uncharacterized protein n=1 Tax=Halocaridina rubra TaxID=373956 RepID=A0AAN8XL33_HALRR